MIKKILVAGVQMDSEILNKDRNLEKALGFAREAHKQGARLIVFPECALTGYCFSDLQEVVTIAETIPGSSTNALQKVCRELDALILIGLIEKTNHHFYNSSALIGSEGVLGTYRKIHLPYLGLDRFVTGGDLPFEIYDTTSGKLGWVICYDGSFPESIRVLTLKGAEIVALLTNWPEGDERVPKYIVPTRAIENHVNYIAVNRVGVERGFRFIGGSTIVDPLGRILCNASSDKEEIIYADVDLEQSRLKRTVITPGVFEFDRIRDRKPEFYRAIVDPLSQ